MSIADNIYLIVVEKSTNHKFSHIRKSSPNMIEGMKKHCDKLKQMFGGEYKIVRLLKTPKGFKKI